MTIAFVVLSCIGLTFILKYGTILSWFRNFLCKSSFLKELFSCSLCLGFWVGIAHSFFIYYIEWNSLYFLLPFASSASCWIADSLISSLQTSEVLMDKIIEK